jgi:hypothetical protein
MPPEPEAVAFLSAFDFAQSLKPKAKSLGFWSYCFMKSGSKACYWLPSVRVKGPIGLNAGIGLTKFLGSALQIIAPDSTPLRKSVILV